MFLIFSEWKTNYLHLKSSNSMWWSSSKLSLPVISLISAMICKTNLMIKNLFSMVSTFKKTACLASSER